ncbi:MAG: hypothetical protein KA072_08975 [Thermoanaerobaculaceae bacterium]|nr:hypothetical protein [Thermoanaerobaculaceae bacterium]MDI9623171.1 hypothetical protein [Acidobacteriota bacterium]NLH09956.1 hypothetical protein [Holophagae bacterium]HPW54515.1 hypothetical protein [Thermoanaerobaculaceae bacterium]
MSTDDLISQLERWLAELSRKWERYFARDPQVPVPPEREREALNRRLRDISRQELHGAAAHFRLDQLLNRFTALNQHWMRQLRQREEAGGGLARPVPAAPAAGVANAPQTSSVSHVDADYRRLFAEYSAALQRTGRPGSVSFDRFRAALEQQRETVQAKGANVEGFEVQEENGQVRVRARVRRGRQG